MPIDKKAFAPKIRTAVKEAADNFIAENKQTVPSQVALAERALLYYIEQFKLAGGVIDGNGFPVNAGPPQGQRRRSTQGRDGPGLKRQGRGPSTNEDGIVVKYRPHTTLGKVTTKR